MKYDEAILWPANEKVARIEGNVPEQKKFLNKHKALYWDNFQKRKELEGPFKGYISVSGTGKVEYECDIEKVTTREKLLNDQKEKKFVPDYRLECLYGKNPFTKKTHEPSSTWIKITKIKELILPKDIKDFTKLNGEEVKRVQGGFVYVKPIL